MEEISLRELFYIFKKWIALILAFTIISVAVAGFVSYYILDPEYQTFTTLMVSKPKDYKNENTIEYNDLILNQKLVSTYGELVKSRVVTDKVIKNLGLDLSYNEFRNNVNINLVKDTEIIKIQVTDNDPVMAADIANETAVVFMDSVKTIMNVENVQVIDKAQVPKGQTKPRPMLNMAIAAVLGFMVGVFLVFLLELLDNTLKTSDDVEKHIGLPILGTIPVFKGEMDALISLNSPKSPMSEAFRTLRTNIQFSSIDKEIKTLIVTSATPSEGKSTISSNLAITISQSDKRVLLIDCDLRKPKVHKYFGLTNQKGLTNILVGGEELSSIVQDIEGTDRVSVLTSGPIPPNPSELIGSKKMKAFLDRTKDDYDMIILDSPPVGLVTDSAILSTISDGLILVIAVGQTHIESVKGGKKLLDKVNSNILGTVLNKVPVSGSSYYKYQYSHYYDDYNEEKDSRKKREKAK